MNLLMWDIKGLKDLGPLYDWCMENDQPHAEFVLGEIIAKRCKIRRHTFKTRVWDYETHDGRRVLREKITSSKVYWYVPSTDALYSQPSGKRKYHHSYRAAVWDTILNHIDEGVDKMDTVK